MRFGIFSGKIADNECVRRWQMNNINSGVSCCVTDCKHNCDGMHCTLTTIQVGNTCDCEHCTCCDSYSKR